MIASSLLFLLALGILVPMQTIKLRSRTDIDPSSYGALFWVAAIGVASGLVVAFVVGYAVMFGPSYVTGDFVGLPWYTMLPAMGAGIWAGAKTNRRVVASLLR